MDSSEHTKCLKPSKFKILIGFSLFCSISRFFTTFSFKNEEIRKTPIDRGCVQSESMFKNVVYEEQLTQIVTKNETKSTKRWLLEMSLTRIHDFALFLKFCRKSAVPCNFARKKITRNTTFSWKSDDFLQRLQSLTVEQRFDSKLYKRSLLSNVLIPSSTNSHCWATLIPISTNPHCWATFLFQAPQTLTVEQRLDSKLRKLSLLDNALSPSSANSHCWATFWFQALQT